MHLRRVHIAFAALTAAAGLLTAALFVRGLAAAGVLGCALLAGLVGWWAGVARRRRPGPPAAPRPATAPPDGHLRFTLAVEGLEPERLAAVWADLCRPDRPATEDLRLLFCNFTVVEGRRFRFRGGDPAATAALLRDVLAGASGVAIRTDLEPAAERTPLWS